MVAWSLDAFAGCGAVAGAVVAVPPGGKSSGHHPNHGLVGLADGLTTTVVVGGATRAESVANALAEVQTEVVAVHDAARPLVTSELIEGLVGDLGAEPEAAAVIAAAAVADTVKRARVGASRQLTRSERANCRVVEETLDRGVLWAAQTPQVFRTEALRGALAVDEATRDAATDEAMLVEAAGGTVLLHEVAEPNFKVTTPADLRLAEVLLAERG